MAKSAARKTPFTGTWHIVSKFNWDEDQQHEETDAFIEFDEDGGGSFDFGEIHGSIDHDRTKKKNRQHAVQFSWHGEDEDGSPLDDIGWALLEDGELRGTICLYNGEEEVEFVATRDSQKMSGSGEQPQIKGKLKLGKSAAFVKTRLKQLEQGDDTWEADFRALPKPKGQAETHFLGLVVALPHGDPLVCLPVEYTPNVNDLADLLAAAMRRPMTDSAHRPRKISFRGNPAWKELFPHLSQLGIEVSNQDELPHVEEVFEDFRRQMRKAKSPPLILTTPSTDVQTAFPAIAKWVQGYGRIEIGDQQEFGFVVRALDYGGLVFEDDKSNTLAEAMVALEQGLAEYFEREGIEV